MFQSPLAPSFDSIKHPSYQVRVRGTMYLWGAAGIAPYMATPILLLHIRNNVFGQPIQLATVSSGGSTPLGTLNAGECYTIAIQAMSGVTAACSTESAVDCLIETHS
jgi:hypothetical protein